MDEDLQKAALRVRDAMPCSVELPAGAGKTHLIAALAATGAELGERTLILTHTNGGVDVLRRRLRQFGVARNTVRVETIASWCFGLVRHYPVLSGLTAGSQPDWAQSKLYYAGAAGAVHAAAIQKVVQASYDLVIVDEYQDCVIEQHNLVLALHELLPVCVFGDPLQNIFDFRGNVTVKWAADVAATWPALVLPVRPWRWRGHNQALGRWLLEIRPDLYDGRPIDLGTAPLRWRPDAGRMAGVYACFDQPAGDGPVVAIARVPDECASVASRTKGSFRMMEELEGSFMLKFAAIVDNGDPRQTAAATLQFAKDSISGIAAKLDPAVKNKLAKGQSVARLSRPGAEAVLSSLSELLSDPSPARVREALTAAEALKDGRLYRREAWGDVLKALMIVSAGSELTVTQAIGNIRNRTRITGRARDDRIISRPLLVKGLEYDHAVVLNAERYKATELYVALSRSRKSLTVVSKQQHLQPDAPQLA